MKDGSSFVLNGDEAAQYTLDFCMVLRSLPLLACNQEVREIVTPTPSAYLGVFFDVELTGESYSATRHRNPVKFVKSVFAL